MPGFNRHIDAASVAAVVFRDHCRRRSVLRGLHDARLDHHGPAFGGLAVYGCGVRPVGSTRGARRELRIDRRAHQTRATARRHRRIVHLLGFAVG